MKKCRLIAGVVALLVIVTILAGCNYQYIDLNYKFDKAYVKIGEEWRDLDIKAWRDYDDGDQIQITLEDGSVLVVHSVNCILYNGELPN